MALALLTGISDLVPYLACPLAKLTYPLAKPTYRYSEFVAFPIELWSEKTTYETVPFLYYT